MHKIILAAAVISAMATSMAAAESQTECERRWMQAEAAGIVHGVGIVDGVPTVQVNAMTWRSTKYETKVGMAETLNCIVAGPDKRLKKIEFVSHRTNHVVGRWTIWDGLTVVER